LPPPVLPALTGFLDLAGIAVFALSGALLAARQRNTIVTLAFFALVTGVGGGSVRDLLIGAPVFWVRDPWVAPVCLGVAATVWLTPQKWWVKTEGRIGLLEWADAAGLAAYAVLGTAKALSYGVPGPGGSDGGDYRLRRGDHPRRAGGSAVDPVATRAVCHCGRALGGIVCRIAAARHP